MSKCRVGSYGETQAINYLKNLGYVILERNYRFNRSEVDIICEKGGVIVFVEVKKRMGDEYGSGIEAVDFNKVKKIVRLAQQYLRRRGLSDKCKVRFDVIGIHRDKLEHIEDAFRENNKY